jgi:transposase
MDATTIAVDLAKHTFEIVIAPDGGAVSRRRLSRAQFATFLRTQPPAQVVMEACATAHYWGRRNM